MLLLVHLLVLMPVLHKRLILRDGYKRVYYTSPLSPGNIHWFVRFIAMQNIHEWAILDM